MQILRQFQFWKAYEKYFKILFTIFKIILILENKLGIIEAEVRQNEVD